MFVDQPLALPVSADYIKKTGEVKNVLAMKMSNKKIPHTGDKESLDRCG